MNGGPCAPSVSCKRLKVPSNTERHVEVKLMSLFYPNNLNHFVKGGGQVQCRLQIRRYGCDVLVSLSREEKFVSGCVEIIQSGVVVDKLKKDIILILPAIA